MAGYDLIQKTRARLAAWIAAEMPTVLGDTVVVREDFPAPNEELAERTVTVLAVEQAPEVRYWPATEFEVTPHDLSDPDDHAATVKYSYGSFKCYLQVDVWARYPDVRSRMLAALDDVLHRQLAVPGGPDWPQPTRWHELALEVDGLPGVVVYFRFDPGQPPIDIGTTAQAAEYRASWTGTAQGLLTTEEACNIIRQIVIDMRVVEIPPPRVSDSETVTLE